MESVYVVLRFLQNKSTKKLIVKPMEVFIDRGHAELWVARRTQVAEIDWYEVHEAKMHLPKKGLLKKLFG